MVEFVPFGVSKTAQDIINEHLNTPKTPSTDVFRNPYYDLRTEQGLPADALYPNPLLDTTPSTDVPVDPCPPGYELIDGICQPIEKFGQSAYQEKNDDNNQEERPYMSIEDMKNASDKDLLDYLTSGFLKNSALGYLPSKGSQVTLGMDMFSPLLQATFGKQNELRKEFILNELMKRGYFTGNFDENQNPIFDIGQKTTNPMLFNSLTGSTNEGIESMLPANTGGAVTDVFGDTYQQVYNSGTGDIGYTFTSGTPLPAVSQQTQTGVNYGTGRGGTSDNQMTGGGNVIIGGNAFNPQTNPEDDYDDESSGI
jgi:hypothetical protein